MSRRLSGQVAIVTGAARGIGRAIALSLAEAGCDVAINDFGRDTEAAQTVADCQAHGVRSIFVPGDVGDLIQVEAFTRKVVAELGSLTIAISNAAYSDRELFHVADMDGFRRTIQVTMWGAFHLTRAAAQIMIEQKRGGNIVLIGSNHAHAPVPGSMAYNMAKAAVEQVSKTAACELAMHRIRVNVIHPGWVDTPGERKFFSEEKLRESAAKLPLGRLQRPDEVGRGVLFLVDPQSDYITGSTLTIDGGIELPVDQMHRLEMPK